jgi:hypothetical protein
MMNKFSLFGSVLSLLVLSALSVTLGATRDIEANGVFINEGHLRIQINVISKDRKETTIFTLRPGTIDRTLFAGGQVKLYTVSKDTFSGRLLFTRSLPTPLTAPQFLEQDTHSFYFRVVDGKIILVKPRDLTSKERKWLEEKRKEGW